MQIQFHPTFQAIEREQLFCAIYMEGSSPAYLLLSGVVLVSLALSHDFDLVKRIAIIVLVFIMYKVFQLLNIIVWSPVLASLPTKAFCTLRADFISCGEGSPSAGVRRDRASLRQN